MSTSFDVIVIGAGPGGYVAAIRLAQLGKRVALIEKEKTLGGTCLNWGCIPSKALLDSSEHYHQAAHSFKTHGITVKGLSLDFKTMMARKQVVVDQTTGGIDFLMKKNNITVLSGHATFKTTTDISVTSTTSTQVISGSHIIIATGSSVTPLRNVPTDGSQIVTSTEALSFKTLPKELIVIGGGVIGVELGSVYARLGTKVTIVEYMDTLLPTMDKSLGKALRRILEKELNIAFHFKTKVTGASVTKTRVTLQAEDAAGTALTLKGEKVLVSIGRKPNTAGLGLDTIGLAVNERGQLPVNDHFQTALPHIYAIGDVIPGPMLAHKASEEGVACAEFIAGKHGHVDYNTVPSVVYTWPEVAAVGKSEEDLIAAGSAYKSGKFPFKASGRARAAEESNGFIKVLSDKETDEVLGVHMIGPRVADVVAEAVLAISYRASAEDLGMTMNPHPTFSEALKEAALDATGKRAIHC